jgi:hypothetical protein
LENGVRGDHASDQGTEVFYAVDRGGDRFTENKGVTIDVNRPIEPVSALPTEPATPVQPTEAKGR